MGYKLIAFDLDGTMLDKAKNVPTENMAAIRAAADKGVYIVPATGRIFKGIPPELRDLDFVRYCITINGAYLYDKATDAALYRAEIPLETTLQILEELNRLPVMPDVYQNGWGWMSQRHYDRAGEFISDPGVRRLITDLRTPVPELRDTLLKRGEPVQKMQAYFKDPALRLRTMEDIARRYPEINVTTSIENNMELNAKTADKGRALTALCAHLGICPEEAIAFGDGNNDATMLAAAGMGVAMANAVPEMKATADMVTASNNEAGVALALKQLGVI